MCSVSRILLGFWEVTDHIMSETVQDGDVVSTDH